MLVVVLWVPTLWVLPSVDTWQLVINGDDDHYVSARRAAAEHSVARRSGCVTKAQRLADGLWDLMGELGDEHPELRRHRRELADAVGLEQRKGLRMTTAAHTR